MNREYLGANLRSITLYALFFPVVEFLTSASIALILWYAGFRAAGFGLTIGVLAAFIQLVRRFFQPLQDLSEKFNLLQSAMASGERIFRLLDTPVEVAEPAHPRSLPSPVRGAVVFEDVWFRYADDAPWALKGVSFRVRPGETVALVGHTGAGKSTVLSLLLRFYAPTRGRILVDGVDLSEVSTASLAPRHRIRAAGPLSLSRFAGAQHPPRSRPRGRCAGAGAGRRRGGDAHSAAARRTWSTRVAERGRSLSVGERQLLSFARALAADPTILLLDEATSAVDPDTEGRIQSALVELRAGRTALIVAHRLGTVLDADRIMVFHHGELRESGSHRELMAARGLYQRLVLLQRGDQRRAESA